MGVWECGVGRTGILREKMRVVARSDTVVDCVEDENDVNVNVTRDRIGVFQYAF